MAIKARVTFFAYNNGKEIKHVNGTTFVNNFDDAEQKMLEFVQKEYPTEASSVTVLFNQKDANIGAWIIFARSDVDTSYYFSFIINKLQ